MAPTVAAGFAAAIPIKPNEAAEGILSDSSPVAANGARYACYSVETRPGQTIVAEVRSTAFEAALQMARGALCSSQTPWPPQAPGTEGAPQSRVELRSPGGRYVILVASRSGLGAFTLAVSADGGPEPKAPTTTAASAASDRVAIMRRQTEEKRKRDEIAAAEAEARRKAEEQRRLAEERRREEQRRLAQQEAQRRASEPSMFEAGLAGLVMGFSGAEPSTYMGANLYDSLTAANEAAAQRAAESKARLDATIAQAQAQAQAEAEAKARAERERQAYEAKVRAERERRQGAPGGPATTQVAQGPSPQEQAKAQAQAQAAKEAEARRQAEAGKAAEARQRAEQQRLAEASRKQEEANQPVAFREGVVLCRQQSPKSWRCEGPLQVTYGDLNGPSGATALDQACGGGNPRSLGMAAGFRAFGCGFGIHPTARDYPGNRDVQAMFGVGQIPGQGTYYCKRSVLAYCKS